MSDVREESYVNNFGQTINPGDEVLFVGMSYGYISSFQKGIYEGMYYGIDSIEKFLASQENREPEPSAIAAKVKYVLRYENIVENGDIVRVPVYRTSRLLNKMMYKLNA